MKSKGGKLLIMVKKMILKVRTRGYYEGLTADYAVVKLDPAAIARIREFSKTVRGIKAYRISEFNYGCEYFIEEWDADPENGLIAMGKFEGQMDCITINVTENDFYWSGNYRDTSIQWETTSVPVSALDESGNLDERGKVQ